jgi:hypothetical protein
MTKLASSLTVIALALSISVALARIIHSFPETTASFKR